MKLCLLVIATSLVIAVTSQMSAMTHNSHGNGTEGKGIDVRITKLATIRRNLTQTAPEGRENLDLLRRDTNNTTSGGSTKLSKGYQQGPPSLDTIPEVSIRAEQKTSNATKTTSEGGVKRGILRRDINNTTSGGSTKLSNGYQKGPASRDTIPGVRIRAELETRDAIKTTFERDAMRGIFRRDINNTTSGGSTKLSNGYQQGPASRDTMPGLRIRAELETSNATKTTSEGDVMRGIFRRDTNNTTSGGSTKLSNGYQQGPVSRDTIPQVRIRAEQNVSNATKTTSEGMLKRGMLLRDTNNTTSAGSTKLRNANNIYGDGYKWESTRRDTNTTTPGGSTQLSIVTKTTEDGYKQKVTGRDTMPYALIGNKTPSERSTKLSNVTKTSEDGYKRESLRRDTNQTTSGGSTKLSNATMTPEDGYQQGPASRNTMPGVRIRAEQQTSNAIKTNQTTSRGGTKRTIAINRTTSDGENKQGLARRDNNQTEVVDIRAKQDVISRDTDTRQIEKKSETKPVRGDEDVATLECELEGNGC